MTNYPRLLEIFLSEGGFVFSDPGTKWCGPAHAYVEWCERLFEMIVTDKPSAVKIDYAKMLIQERYHELRSVVSYRHRDKLSTQGHRCIYEVYVETYNRLKVEEFTLMPPLLSSRIMRPKFVDLGGTILGEEEPFDVEEVLGG